MRFQTKLLRRCLLSSALLASGATASAADQHDHVGFLKGLITGRRAAPAEKAAPREQSTTVQAELQKLFEAGQTQTAQHEIVTAASPVQLVQHQSEESSSGLLNQLFGGGTAAQRRAIRLENRLNRTNSQGTNQAPFVPKPPPIDFTMPQRPQQTGSINARPVGFSNEIGTPPGVPPVQATPNRSMTLRPPTPAADFVSPFIDDESLERNDIMLDLDSLMDRPTNHSAAMPIITDGEVTEKLVELPIPLKVPAFDPLLEDSTVTLPSVKDAGDEIVAADPIDPKPVRSTIDTKFAANMTATRTDQTDTVISVTEEDEEVIVIQSEGTSTKVIAADTAATAGTMVSETRVSETQASEAQVSETQASEAQVSEARVSEAQVSEARVSEAQGNETQTTTEAATVVKDQTSETKTVQNERFLIQEKQARRQQQQHLILSRAGRKGFKGFCPVALRENRMLRDSSTTHAARFGLKTYYFSSNENRLLFEADPAHYAPAAGGSDVVLLANTGEETDGSLDFCLWYRDRLYMFRSRETQAIFSTNPTRFANQY